MKKLLSLSIVIIVVISVWLNVKDKTDIIQSEDFNSPKKVVKIDLSKELALLGADTQDTLKTSFQSSSPFFSPSSSSSSSSLSSALPVASLNLEPTSISQSVKSAMEKYLKDSSDLKFPDNTDVSLALFEARDGNSAKMNNVVKSFKEKIPKLEALIPPTELKEFHEKSLMAIKNYTALLEKIAQIAGNKEKILEILNSLEMNTARNTAREILTNLREIVQKYNLSVPAEVLPKDKIPSVKP